MKEKTLQNEHQKLFTRIDNLLESEVVQFEMQPDKKESARVQKISSQLPKDLYGEALNLSSMGIPSISAVFTRPELKKTNPLDL